MIKTNFFEPIQLEQMDRVKFMKRTDTKYCFHIKYLPKVLQLIRSNYYVLSIQGENQLRYSTTYFDTLKNEMYEYHHNGRLTRLKIRHRCYMDSGTSFLEIKFKNNKGLTTKKRIACDQNPMQFTEKESKFINSLTPYCCDELIPSIKNEFTRITLVNMDFKERCTIDFNLCFKRSNQEVDIDNLVIVEIKSDLDYKDSPLIEIIKNLKINYPGFSKYCIGRAILEPSLKQNAFKPKIRNIEKLTGRNLRTFKKAKEYECSIIC